MKGHGEKEKEHNLPFFFLFHFIRSSSGTQHQRQLLPDKANTDRSYFRYVQLKGSKGGFVLCRRAMGLNRSLLLLLLHLIIILILILVIVTSAHHLPGGRL